MKRKPIIGILPFSCYMGTNDSFADKYCYGNNYVKKIVENDGIPYFIPLCDDKIINYELLDMCDGLLLQGGNKIKKFSLEVIDYFYKKDKPILGICLGIQTLGLYSIYGIDLSYEDEIIVKLDEENSHYPKQVFRDNEEILAHNNFIKCDTKLFEIFKQDIINVNSLHRYALKKVGKDFIVSMRAEDGIIEGIESKDKRFIVGVQFHPEILSQYNCLFKKFIEECKR